MSNTNIGEIRTEVVEQILPFHNDRLVIVSGITGALGRAFYDHLSNKEYNLSKTCLGICRSNPVILGENDNIIQVDLLEKEKVESIINELDFNDYSEILYIHPVGMFKFEYTKEPLLDLDNDSIDDEVYSSNVQTFVNIVMPILKKAIASSKKVTICAFGSISDKYKVPFWQSYTKSKDIVRDLIKNCVKENEAKNLVRGIFINVSTTDTGNENKLRPNANRDYWLNPEEIAMNSLHHIMKLDFLWKEIDLYKVSPNYTAGYFQDYELVLSKWKKEMGLK